MFSDVYVFGIGEQVNKEQLNALASQKSGETHVFFLKDYETLGEVFNSIISKEAFCTASPVFVSMSLSFWCFTLTRRL